MRYRALNRPSLNSLARDTCSGIIAQTLGTLNGTHDGVLVLANAVYGFALGRIEGHAVLTQ